MKNNKIKNIIQSKNIIIPIYIFKLRSKLNIDLDVFVFLMYLYSLGEKIIFDAKKIGDEFGISTKDVLSFINILSEKHLICFEIIKNEKNISEEFLSLSSFYEKISLLLIEQNEITENDNTIFSVIEKEFGRVLSPMEYEIIRAWIESGISNELIIEALKEAVFNGVNNLRYIDIILYEKKKKGIKNIEDVEKYRKSHESQEEKMEVFEYTWLEEE